MTTIKAAISPFGQPFKATKPDSVFFLEEDFISTRAGRIVDEFTKLPHFLPIVVLIPRSAIHEKPAQNLALDVSDAGLHDGPNAPSYADSAIAFPRHSSVTDTCAFGEVSISFTSMETHRNGQLVALTRKEFKTMAYLIKNVRRVISRDELLKEVWGYECYPSTRTVDMHIMRLRAKLEPRPARPKHFLTVHGEGYRFVP